MLKDFEIVYLDKTGYQMNVRVLAFDADQAVHTFIYTHPGVNSASVKCKSIKHMARRKTKKTMA